MNKSELTEKLDEYDFINKKNNKYFLDDKKVKIGDKQGKCFIGHKKDNKELSNFVKKILIKNYEEEILGLDRVIDIYDKKTNKTYKKGIIIEDENSFIYIRFCTYRKY